jgi:hypothetical protein
VHQLRPELSTPRLEMYQLHPKVSASCVAHTDTTKSLLFTPPEMTEKRTRSAKDLSLSLFHTHTHTTQHLISRHFRQLRIPEVHGISYSVSHVLAITLICKLISCCNYSTLSDIEHSSFLLELIHI